METNLEGMKEASRERKGSGRWRALVFPTFQIRRGRRETKALLTANRRKGKKDANGACSDRLLPCPVKSSSLGGGGKSEKKTPDRRKRPCQLGTTESSTNSKTPKHSWVKTGGETRKKRREKPPSGHSRSCKVSSGKRPSPPWFHSCSDSSANGTDSRRDGEDGGRGCLHPE